MQQIVKQYSQKINKSNFITKLLKQQSFTQNNKLFYSKIQYGCNQLNMLNINFKPKYNLLQNSKRLRSKSKKLEIDVPHIEKELFLDEARMQLYKLKQAFIKLEEFEDRITEIEMEENEQEQQIELRVEIKEIGQYRFLTNTKDRILYFYSPISGVFKYYYDVDYEMWKSTRDLHLLIDNLVREITFNCKGYLDL